MGKAISYFFKRNQKFFKRQEDLKQRLGEIRKKYEMKMKVYLDNQEDINDLIDYLEDVHPDNEILNEKFNLENCRFYVDISPDAHQNRGDSKCFFIIDENGKSQHFGITRFKVPTPMVNFRDLCRNLIAPIKLEIRKSKLQENEMLEDYDLVHVSPKFSDVVKIFVEQRNLNLDQVVSPNGSGNNIPKLNQGFEYLADDFLKFYKEQYSDIGKQYELKKSKKNK